MAYGKARGKLEVSWPRGKGARWIGHDVPEAMREAFQRFYTEKVRPEGPIPVPATLRVEIPLVLVTDDRLHVQAIRVWAAMRATGWDTRIGGTERLMACVSEETLSIITGLSGSSVKAAIDSLEQHGYISKAPDDYGPDMPPVYEIWWSSETLHNAFAAAEGVVNPPPPDS